MTVEIHFMYPHSEVSKKTLILLKNEYVSLVLHFHLKLKMHNHVLPVSQRCGFSGVVN